MCSNKCEGWRSLHPVPTAWPYQNFSRFSFKLKIKFALFCDTIASFQVISVMYFGKLFRTNWPTCITTLDLSSLTITEDDKIIFDPNVLIWTVLLGRSNQRDADAPSFQKRHIPNKQDYRLIEMGSVNWFWDVCNVAIFCVQILLPCLMLLV
jgi:hypothetical protein